MKLNPGQLWHSRSEASELTRKALGHHGLAVFARTHQRLRGLPNAKGQQLLRLFALMPAELIQGEAREGDDASLAGLGRLEP